MIKNNKKQISFQNYTKQFPSYNKEIEGQQAYEILLNTQNNVLPIEEDLTIYNINI